MQPIDEPKGGLPEGELAERELPEGLRALSADVHRELRSLDPRAAERFTRLLAYTWGRAMRPLPDGEVFVLTGDIPAMWLRDSTAQVRPYLLAADDPVVAAALTGVLRRQLWYVLADPYANAFNAEPDGSGAGHTDDPTPTRWSGNRSTRSTRSAPRSSSPTASGAPPAASATSPPTTASFAPPAGSSPCGGPSRTTRTAHRTSSGASATTSTTRWHAAAGARRPRPPE